MKVMCHVEDMDFLETLGEAHVCAYPIYTRSDFQKSFASAWESPQVL